jgi:hypothetical protein
MLGEIAAALFNIFATFQYHRFKPLFNTLQSGK